MVNNLCVAILFRFVVDGLLLLASGRLTGREPWISAAAFGASLGAMYGCLCLLPGFRFMGSFFWRMVSLSLMSMATFGIERTAVRAGAVFIFLSMAMSGIGNAMDRGGMSEIVASAACLLLLYGTGIWERPTGGLIPVELSHGQTCLHLTGLRDTGNMLRDPVSGQQVLVAGAEVAKALMGLTKEQLQDPVSTVRNSPVRGLRLIPYKTVGQESRLLLAVRLPNTKVGSWRGSSVVAFAPEGLGAEGTYQVLTGGCV